METTKFTSDSIITIANAIKVGLVFIWLSFIIIAGYNNQLIEAYLLSLAIALLSFFIFRKRDNSIEDSVTNVTSITGEKFNSETYLKVFF